MGMKMRASREPGYNIWHMAIILAIWFLSVGTPSVIAVNFRTPTELVSAAKEGPFGSREGKKTRIYDEATSLVSDSRKDYINRCFGSTLAPLSAGINMPHDFRQTTVAPQHRHFPSDTTKVYSSIHFDARLRTQLGAKCLRSKAGRSDPQGIAGGSPGCQMDTLRLLNAMADFFPNETIWVQGGTIRDLLVNPEAPLHDVDVKFTMDSTSNESIKTFCKTFVQPMAMTKCHIGDLEKIIAGSRRLYVKFTRSFEGTTLTRERLTPDDLENDINSFYYDLHRKELIDPLGTGIESLKLGTFKLSLSNKRRGWNQKLDAWSQGDIRVGLKALRVFKMYQKGFHLAEEHVDPFRSWLYNQMVRNKSLSTNNETQIMTLAQWSPIARFMLLKIRNDRLTNTGGVLRGKDRGKLKSTLVHIFYFSSAVFNEIKSDLCLYDVRAVTVDLCVVGASSRNVAVPKPPTEGNRLQFIEQSSSPATITTGRSHTNTNSYANSYAYSHSIMSCAKSCTC